MKLACIGCLIGLCILPVSAQQFKRIFLFDSYVEGKILFKNHSMTRVNLNYDASNKVLLYMQGDERMELTVRETIDTIYVGRRKWVPAPKGFYEVVRLPHGTVLIDWLLKEVNVGSKGALGAVTQGTVQNLQMHDFGLEGTEMYTPYQAQQWGATDVYQRKNGNVYYLYIDGKMHKVQKLKQLEKLFPEHRDEIRHFVESHRIQMSRTIDVLSLLDYCLPWLAEDVASH